MKVWKKNMLIAAGGLLAVGVIFCAIGLATGAKSVNYHNGKITIGDKLMGSTSFSSQNIADILPLKEKQTISLSGQKISSIDCDDGLQSDVTIQQGNDWEISYQLAMPERFSYQIDDQELKLSYKRPANTGTDQSENITITVPKGTSLEDVDLSSSMGDLLIQDISCKEIHLDSSLGDVSLKNLSAGELDLSGSLGDITAQGITVSDKVSVDGSMGNITLDGTLLCDIDISGGMGDSKLILHGASLGDYDYDVDCSMGDLLIDGADVSSEMMGGSYQKDNGQDREIHANGGMGDIKIQFQK